MRKLSARWMPHLLTLDQIYEHVKCGKANLQLFQHNLGVLVQMLWQTKFRFLSTYFKLRTVKIIDCKKGKAPKKAKTIPSAGKVIASVFCILLGCHIHISWKQVIPSLDNMFSYLILCTKNTFDQKVRYLSWKNNACFHTCAVVSAKRIKLCYKFLPHFPYIPNVAPSDNQQ